MIINPDFYKGTGLDAWNGRSDGFGLDVQRWHQRIAKVDLKERGLPVLSPGQKGVAMIGFACDEGVRRNLGRIGAKKGPYAFRKAASSLPVHFDADLVFLDLGDIAVCGLDMEGAQEALSILVSYVLKAGYNPLVIGGGHEVLYGHYTGISNFLSKKETIGIVNFDAHFDLREPKENGSSSGTGFWQIANDCKEAGLEFHYLPLGIQKISNTRRLFETAEALKVSHISAEMFSASLRVELLKTVDEFIRCVDHIYLTVCLDVFSSAFAPGVSAPAYSGIIPDPVFFDCFDSIFRSDKVISMDIAELNPEFDVDQRTAKLAAALAFKAIMSY
jgi:formiminoglutamase